MLQKKSHCFNLILLAVVTLGVFGNVLRNGFVWDDNIFVVGNTVYQQFDLGKMFFSLANRIEYLPLRDITYALDYAFWGERAVGFHFSNLLLYLANVLVVYYLSERIYLFLAAGHRFDAAQSAPVALLSALFFAVHPIHCETVDFIICRNALVSGLFFFLSCYLYLLFLSDAGAARRLYYWGALLCFFCALLAKATVLTLPLVLLLLVCYAPRRRNARDLLLLAPFFALSFGFYLLFKQVGLNSKMLYESSLKFNGSVLSTKLATAVQIPLFYLGKLLVPVRLSAYYDVTFASSLAAAAVWAALVALVALLLLAVKYRTRYAELLFGIGWFAATVIPVLNFFSTNPVVADRYLFLPSFGFFFLLACFLNRFLADKRKPLALGCIVALLVFWSASAVLRNTVWKNEKTLWEETIRTSPKVGLAYVNLGDACFREGDYDRAFALFTKSREFTLIDDYYQLYQGRLFDKRGNLPAAIDAFKNALRKNPQSVEALYHLGDLSDREGDSEQAMKSFRLTIASQDKDPFGMKDAASKRLNLLSARVAPQLDELRQKVAADPRNPALRRDLALQLDALGFYDEALENYLAVEKLGIKQWQLYANIGTVYRNQKKYPEAIHYYELSLALNPRNAELLTNLGVACRKAGRLDSAIAYLENAIASGSTSAQAPFNLAAAYSDKGNKDKAIYYLRYTQEKFPKLAAEVAPYLQKLQGR